MALQPMFIRGWKQLSAYVGTLYWWFTLLQIVGGKIYEYFWNGNRYGRYQKSLSVL